MASPLPSTPLQGHCSVINDNILYVYTQDAFQALPLTQNATWSSLPSNGVPVSGAACVKQVTTGSGGNVMWVVGGVSNSSSYPGLQRYLFGSKVWETITPVVNVTQNRQNHAASLIDSTSILVYAGSQMDAPLHSSETFVIQTNPPYLVQAFSSTNAPALQPQLLEFNASAALALGGVASLREMYQFTVANGWRQYPTMLSTPLKSRDLQQSVLVTGSDGSKVLEVYDMSVSPNTVTEIVLQLPNGQPAATGMFVGVNATKSRRDLSLSSWPAYNGSYAPTATRSGFSIAQSTDGTVAIAGGNAQDPVALYNGQANSWIDTTRFFGVNMQTSAAATSSLSSSVSSTATASPSLVAAPTNDTSSHPRTSLILGATLGSILGFIALMILALLLITWRRRKRRQQTELKEKEERRLSFADQGAPFMAEAGGAINKPTLFNSPHSSIAIISGRVGPGHTRNGGPEGSNSSTAKLVVPQKSRLGQDDGLARLEEDHRLAGENDDMARIQLETDGTTTILPPANNPGLFAPVVLAESTTPSHLHSVEKRSRNSGWSGYFAAAPDRPRSDRVDARTSLRQVSEHDCNTHGPTQIPPLGMGDNFERRVSDVMAADPPAPSTNHSQVGARRTTHESASEGYPFPVTEASYRRGPLQSDRASSVYTHHRGPSETSTGPPRMAGLSPLSTNVQTMRQPSGSAIWPMSSEPIQRTGVATPMRIKKVGQSPKGKGKADADMSWVNLGTA